jgi:ABC-2 type transport system permease protein
LRNAPIAIVDEDRSPLSHASSMPSTRRISATAMIQLAEVDQGMDSGRYNFTLVIPANFQRDVQAGKPDVQLNIDATIMSPGLHRRHLHQEHRARRDERIPDRRRDGSATPITLTTRVRFNPNLTGVWFGGVMEVINNVTMLTIILVGAAFIREREHGTIEHLLVMPLTPFEIMMAKIWANGLAC